MNQKKIIGGLRAKSLGKDFEDFISKSLQREGWGVIQLPSLGARVVSKTKTITTTVPFDFIAGVEWKTILFDAKVIGLGEKLTYSRVLAKPHQVRYLHYMCSQRACHKAGFLVLFVKSDKIVFFNANRLVTLNRGQSLTENDGIILGERTGFVNWHLLL